MADPVILKLEFYSKLDSSGFLCDTWKSDDLGATHVAMFVLAAFENVDTNTALNMLEYSNSWRDYPKTQQLRDSLIYHKGKRFLPALQFKNNNGHHTSQGC